MACVVVPPAELVKQVYMAAEKYLKGEPVEKHINIDIAVADAYNVDEFWP
jgi:ABC-type sugar transport system substrate-binding protein